MSSSIWLAEVTAPCVNLRDMGARWRGNILQIAETNAAEILRLARQGGVIKIREATSADVSIEPPAPQQPNWTESQIAERLKDRGLLFTRALELSVTREPESLPKGMTWGQVAVREETENMNAALARERATGRRAIEEIRKLPATELEAEAARLKAQSEAVRRKLVEAKKITGLTTRGQLADVVEAARLELERRVGDPALGDVVQAQGGLDAAELELAAFEKNESHNAAVRVLTPIMADFDVAPTSASTEARPFVEAATLALAEGRFEDAQALASKIRDALSHKVVWKTESGPAIYGEMVDPSKRASLDVTLAV